MVSGPGRRHGDGRHPVRGYEPRRQAADYDSAFRRAAADHLATRSRAPHRGYLFDSKDPLFPFGFGLSYTTFEIGAPKLSATQIPKNGSVTVSVDVRNTGKVAGDEVVQLYLRDVVSSVTRPKKELKGFKRVALAPGASTTVNPTLGAQCARALGQGHEARGGAGRVPDHGWAPTSRAEDHDPHGRSVTERPFVQLTADHGLRLMSSARARAKNEDIKTRGRALAGVVEHGKRRHSHRRGTAIYGCIREALERRFYAKRAACR